MTEGGALRLQLLDERREAIDETLQEFLRGLVADIALVVEQVRLEEDRVESDLKADLEAPNILTGAPAIAGTPDFKVEQLRLRERSQPAGLWGPWSRRIRRSDLPASCGSRLPGSPRNARKHLRRSAG